MDVQLMGIMNGQERLTSPSRVERLAQLEALLQDRSVDSNVIRVLLLIENVPADLYQYRDRERHLEDLIKILLVEKSAQSERMHIISFRYLMGSLYVNFEKFWGPTLRIISEILKRTCFQSQLLRVALEHLGKTNDIIYNEPGAGNSFSSEDRPDHILHRNFIFQVLAKFVHLIELDSVYFIDQFFRFVQKELCVSPFIAKLSRDDLTDLTESENQEQPHEHNSPDKKPEQTRFKKKSHLFKAVLQKRKSRETFITVAKIIQSFRDMSKIHRQVELRELMMELLCCRDSSVQKAALNCILAFDDEFIKPYSNKLLKLINDKSARTELTTFSIDSSETSQIQEAHRGEVVPIILRLLFGKMTGQIGKKSSGKDKSDVRRSLVMRFIIGCIPEETKYFFNILFDPLFPLIEIPYSQLEQKLRENLNLSSYIPLNKLQAMLSSLNTYMDTVAHIQEDSLPSIFKLINIITFFVITPLEDPDLSKRLNSFSLKNLKALRRECTNTVAAFYQKFEYYPFQQEETDFVFKHLIWNSLHGFIDKNFAHPSPLLKLIRTFASNPVYHSLLVKRNKNRPDEFLLNHIIDLYTDPKTQRQVLVFLASLIADVLKPDRDLPEDVEPDPKRDPRTSVVLPDRDSVIPEYDEAIYKISCDVPYNQKILLKFLPRLFERLKTNFEEFVNKKETGNRIESDELLVLSTLSQFPKDPVQSLLAARLLLSSITIQKRSELIISTLKAVQTLFRQVKSTDSTIISLLANMISHQRNPDHREELCRLISLLAGIDHNLSAASKTIQLLNATGTDLGSPDLVKLNEGFQVAFRFIDELDDSSMNRPEEVRDSLLLLICQTCYIINNSECYDFSVRENCLVFYEKLSIKMKSIDRVKNIALIRMLIDDTLLERFIKKGFRETNETIKHTYMTIARSLAIYCHDQSRVLTEFYLFCDDNLDIDFWHNIKHIQLHNRSKSLARLIASDKLSQVSSKTLSSYFLPIASGFLFSRAYKSVASLTENSIKLIGLICNRLNWVTYEANLNYYIGQLTNAKTTYQRTNIKLITEILKNFNFDLTSCEEAMHNREENEKLEKRMRKRHAGIDEHAEVIATSVPTGKRTNASTARMIYSCVTKKLLPKLNSCFHEMTRVEFEHDKNMAGYLPEKEEIKRIPMAFAIVQLLNLLPGRYVLFRDNLPSIFLKLSSFLKSKTEQVRKAARAVLVKVMSFVGSAYLPDLLRILKQSLEKGFQIHVLNYTIHSILEKLSLTYGCLDHSIHELINSCFQEIFGRLAEDKDIAQILAKTSEAKKTKSYDTLLIISSYISAEKLDYLVNSIRELLRTSNEPKTVNKLSICLQRIFTGLSRNDGFPLDKMFAFIQSTILESIPNLKIRQKIDQVEGVAHDDSSGRSTIQMREDRFLVTKALPRDRIKSKINEKGNYHMLVENCLRLLLVTLETNKAVIKQKEKHKKRLDGFIRILSTCLKSSSPKCIMRALKCIYFIAQVKIDLPSLKTKVASVVKRIFILLSQYNGVGMVQGDNSEMIAMCFKTITLLMLKCDDVRLEATQLQALLSYVEQDLYDTNRQATAFSTLQSILQRGYVAPQLNDLMVRVADLLVTSEDETVRSLSIKCWQTYLLEYKHQQPILQTHLTKFLRQLDYVYPDGRISVIRMLTVIVTKFPEKLLRFHLDMMFPLLAQRILNEESKEVRLLVGKLIALLVQRLNDQQTHLFNKFVIPWASNANINLKILGIKLISIFVESSRSFLKEDRHRMREVLLIIATNLELDKTSSSEASILPETREQEVSGEIGYTPIEHRLDYHSLRLFLRLLNQSLIKSVELRHIEFVKRIWQSIATYKLAHPYLPVVLTSCELYLTFIESTDLRSALDVNDPSPDNYLNWNAKRIVKTLCDRFIDLFDRAAESDQLLGYITKGLILLGQIVANSKESKDFEQKYVESFEGGDVLNHLTRCDNLPKNGFLEDHLPYEIHEAKKRVVLMWLAIKVVMQARKEAALYRSSRFYRRNFVLQWTATIAQELGPRRILPYSVLFIMTPVRELSDKGKSNIVDVQHKTLPMSEDLLKFIKGLIGVEVFNDIYSRVQLHYTRRRVERKKTAAIIKVKDQVRGVKRKLKLHKDKDNKRKVARKSARKERGFIKKL